MKYRIVLSFLTLISVTPVFASPDDLQKGVAVTTENMAELVQTSLPLSVARSGQGVHDDPFVSAFFFDETSSLVYSISDNNYLYVTKYPERNLLNRWPLARWSHEYLEEEVSKTYYNGFHPSIYDLDQYVADELKLTQLMGCMQAAPLRYGDVDGNGQPELVLFLADQVSTDFLMFSLAKQKVIFSSKLNFTDSIHVDDIPDHYPHESNYQYLSWRDVRTGEPPTPAIRAYGKLYFGDFDADEKRDILVWRKVYETNLKSEDPEGFKKTDEILLHYSLVDGEYLPQKTDPVAIESWLTANELTWPDGYPRLSECPGEEGELIAEMHDPLLNDPDVLPAQP